MDIKQFVTDLDLAHEETKRMNCPVCGGIKTFTATNSMGSLLWNCYKATCHVGGQTRIRMSAEDLQKVRSRTKSTEGITELEPPPYWTIPTAEDVPSFYRHCDAYNFDPEKIGLTYDVKENRIVYPIYHKGILVDACGKSLSKRLPKWKRYGKSQIPYTYGRDITGTVVVVEDCISATVVGDIGLTGLALLGTSLLDVHRTVISKYSKAIIALDRDALPKLMSMAKELRPIVENVQVMRLNDDVKYQHPDDMNYLRGEV